jgi:hypothetical protein
MALRASSKKNGGDADVTAITRDEPRDGGVEHGALLSALVDAVIDQSADPSPARRNLLEAAGPGLLVEAAASLAIFHLNDRVADAVGAPLDDLMIDYRRNLGAQMGIEDQIEGRL